jgi:2-oxoisovalerate dehydrogenase E1 component alpha subunit
VATTMLSSQVVPDLEPVQLVRPDGTRADHHRYSSGLEGDELVALFDAMIVTRTVDQEFINLQRQGQLALYPSCKGQEAAQVGLAAALNERDWLFPQYRELGAWVWRGVDPGGVAVMWRGTWHGGADLLEHASAPISIPIGTQALHAVGFAMGIALDGESAVAVACIGDGATSEGDVHEAMNFAAVYKAPCVFFVQNNQWAISVPLREQTKSASIAHKAIAYGMPGVRCDGNDVLATQAVVKDAVERARQGGGPTLVEAVTYRLEAHTTSDDPTRYRSAQELEVWEQLDPLSRYDRMLQREGLLTDEIRAAIASRASAAAQRLRDAVVDVPAADPDDLFDYVFVEPTQALLEQREELRAELRHHAT